jgi:hypothetical protein
MIYVSFKHAGSGHSHWRRLALDAPNPHGGNANIYVFVEKEIKIRHILIPFGEKKRRCDASLRLSSTKSQDEGDL